MGPRLTDADSAWRHDDAAFAAEYTAHFARVRGVALGIVRSPALAEDIAQEAFVRAWRARARFTPQARFSTWVARIAVNASLDYLKSGRRRYELSVADLPPAATPARVERTLVEQQTAAAVHRAIDALPAMYREPLLLRDIEGLSYAEVSQRTGLPASTLKMRVLRARRKVGETLLATGEWPEKRLRLAS